MKRSKHSLSHFKLLTANMGELVPIGLTEVLPGDTVQHATSMLLRMSPLLSPVYTPLHARIHHWFVPHRLVWDSWEDFITGGPDGLDASVFPTITLNPSNGDLADYLGVPTGTNIAVSALPFRGYGMIWNEWYRDQDLQTALTVATADGADSTTNTTLQNVCWEKDYFTSARPWTQKGADVTLPLGTEAPVTGLGWDASSLGGAPTASKQVNESGATQPTYAYAHITDPSGAGGADNKAQLWVERDPSNIYYPNIYADLSNATAATINELREAMAIQRYEEARARYGSRYTEYLRYLGVRSSDARLQRPEYLGGGRQTVQFSEVLQTGVTTSGTPNTGVGSLLGHGIGAVRSNRYRRFFEEHGYVFSLLSVLPKTIYANGLPRHWSRSTKEDFFQKELQHIGQQEVLNKEVYTAHSSPNGVFGYQDRYDEYRRNESGVSGDFRSTLNYWHLARLFGSDPALNATFVSANPSNRIFQSTSSDQLYVMAMHSMQARRLVAKVGTSSVL